MAVTTVQPAQYTVGAVYISTVATSPAQIYGGVWEQIKDRFILAAGDTYTAGAIGGEPEHLLTGAEAAQKELSITGGTHKHSLKGYGATLEKGSTGWRFGSAGTQTATGIINGDGDHTHTVTASNAAKAHNNMPPYLAVYIWKRVA